MERRSGLVETKLSDSLAAISALEQKNFSNFGNAATGIARNCFNPSARRALSKSTTQKCSIRQKNVLPFALSPSRSSYASRVSSKYTSAGSPHSASAMRKRVNHKRQKREVILFIDIANY
ncbi:MAG: hypothetical protein ACOC4C_02100 [Fibrobacterota bacterium]